MIVVDASVLIDVFIGQAVAAKRLATTELCAPHLVDSEVGAVLRRHTLGGQTDPDLVAVAFDDYLSIEITRHPHLPLMSRAWELRDTISFTDALYVTLAEVLDAPLLTLDARLARVPGTRATIEVPGTP